MSGGLFDYENNKMYDWADKIWTNKTKDEIRLSILLRDLADVLHKYDYWKCGDIGREEFEKAFYKLKKKYKIKFTNCEEKE